MPAILHSVRRFKHKLAHFAFYSCAFECFFVFYRIRGTCLMRKWGFLILMLCLLKDSYAQDPNFSQFFVSPLTLNPALTGKFNGDVRVAGNYRDQWPEISKAYITS